VYQDKVVFEKHQKTKHCNKLFASAGPWLDCLATSSVMSAVSLSDEVWKLKKNALLYTAQ